VNRIVRRRRARQAGFTLIELMISLVMFSFAIAGILAVATTLARGFRDQKVTVGAEGAARAAMDYIGDAIRGSSPGVSTGNIQALYEAGCTDPTVGNTVLVNETAGQPDDLTIVFASGSVATSLGAAFSGGTSMTVNDASEIGPGDMVLVSDFARGHLAKVSSVSGSSLTLGSQLCAAPVWPATGSYAQGAIVVRALRAKFFIALLDNIPTLWMDPDAEGPDVAEPLAEGVEDFQVAVAIDANGDGLISDVGLAAGDDEWVLNVAGETLPPPPYTIRALRITLVAITVGQQTGVASFYRPAALNHAAGTVADNFRRRVLTSTIEVRNLVGSP
jgi:prepilin-type N-terminal cleavage/methylation domain-containing protein